MKIHLILFPFLLIQFLTGTFLPANPQDTREMSGDISQQSTCVEKSGKVETRTIQSIALNRALEYRVYTPPCYNSSAADPYPVLYLLHGSSANADQWIQLGLQTQMDALLAEGKIIPFLVVLPHEAAYLEDTRTSKYGQAILEELIPAVQKNFRVAIRSGPHRDRWSIPRSRLGNPSRTFPSGCIRRGWRPQPGFVLCRYQSD